MGEFDWIIGVCNSAENGVGIFRFRGTIEEAKAKLVSLVSLGHAEDPENWERGTEEVEYVDSLDNGLGYELYAYGCYSDYHIDYSAKEWAHVEFV